MFLTGLHLLFGGNGTIISRHENFCIADVKNFHIELTYCSESQDTHNHTASLYAGVFKIIGLSIKILKSYLVVDQLAIKQLQIFN